MSCGLSVAGMSALPAAPQIPASFFLRFSPMIATWLAFLFDTAMTCAHSASALAVFPLMPSHSPRIVPRTTAPRFGAFVVMRS